MSAANIDIADAGAAVLADVISRAIRAPPASTHNAPALDHRGAGPAGRLLLALTVAICGAIAAVLANGHRHLRPGAAPHRRGRERAGSIRVPSSIASAAATNAGLGAPSSAIHRTS